MNADLDFPQGGCKGYTGVVQAVREAVFRPLDFSLCPGNLWVIELHPGWTQNERVFGGDSDWEDSVLLKADDVKFNEGSALDDDSGADGAPSMVLMFRGYCRVHSGNLVAGGLCLD